MERAISKQSHSWQWDNHINPTNSKWLAENIEEMDHAIKQMLKLIEEDGDSFPKKAETYDQRQPELVSVVEDFYRLYHSLAEQYDHVTRELRKTISSELQMQGSGSGSDSSSPPTSPEKKLSNHKKGHRAAGLDAFLGSGHPQKGSDNSSSSSQSDSESEDDAAKSQNLSLVQNGNGDVHHLRIRELQKEIDILSEKLQAYENGTKCRENGSQLSLESKMSNLEEELSQAKEKLSASEEEVSKLKIVLGEKELMLVERESLHIGYNLIEAKLKSEREQTTELQKQIFALGKEVTDREQTIELLKMELSAVKESFSQEKTTIQAELHGLVESKELEIELEKKTVFELHKRIKGFEAHISNHKNIVADLKAEICEATENFLDEKLQLQEQISSLTESYKSLEVKHNCLEDELTRYKSEKTETDLALEKLRTENNEKGRQFETLQMDYDSFSQTYDFLVAKKDELSAKVLSLLANISSRDNQITQLNGHLNQLQMEHLKLIQELEKAKQESQELSTRVENLKVEVDRQRDLISDHAEGKREAIRQLCFSIEHYRDGYEELLQALHGQRRKVLAF